MPAVSDISAYLADNFGANATYVEGLLARFRADPRSVDESWRLFFEGLGAAVYERCVRSQTSRPVQLADFRQLVYLAGAERRVLVTDDTPLLRLGRAVIHGRYEDAQVVSFNEFLAMAS